MVSNEVGIVIGSWGSYNECNERALGSKWICLNDFEEWEDIEEELKKQGFELDGIDEELFVQDIDNLPSNYINWDYTHPKQIFELLKKSGVLDDEYKFEKMCAYCEVNGFENWWTRVERDEDGWDDGIYLYPNYDWNDLAHYFIDEVECWEIPDCLKNYIDYNAYARELQFDHFYEYENGIVEIRR